MNEKTGDGNAEPGEHDRLAGDSQAVKPLARRVLDKLALGRLAGVVIGLVLVCLYLGVTNPLFLTWGNISNIFRAQSVVFIIAIGMSFVILTGGLDLSVASLAGTCSVVLGVTMASGMSWWVSVLACIGVGLALGFFNGALIGRAHISFFVVTLGTLSMYSSLALLITSGSTVSLFSYARFKPLQHIANNSFGPIPVILLIIAALYVVAWIVLSHTPFGRYIYAIGSNSDAARLNGINVDNMLVLVYTISGLMCALGAIQQTGRLTAASPVIDPNLMLTVIAAVLIGGMTMSGGAGGLIGTVLGVLFLGVIQNGLSLSNVSTFWQGMVTGAILILAVGLAVLRESELSHELTRLIGRKSVSTQG